ncbi:MULTISPECIES: hypothetical protein [unclassified Microcoleus]
MTYLGTRADREGLNAQIDGAGVVLGGGGGEAIAPAVSGGAGSVGAVLL